MGVVIESSVWEPSRSLFVFILLSSAISIVLHPYRSKNGSGKASAVFDRGVSSSASRFQRTFLLVYSLASVMEGLWSVFGELEMDRYGVSKEEMLLCLCVGYSVSVNFSAFSGMLSDVLGHKKFCLIFCILHPFVGIWKQLSTHPGACVASICLSLASSIFLFSFEAWVLVEHEKQGHRQETLSDIFWLMGFFESGSLIGSQVLANWLLGGDARKSIASPSVAVIFLSVVAIFCIAGGWEGTPHTSSFVDYRMSFCTYIFGETLKLLLKLWNSCRGRPLVKIYAHCDEVNLWRHTLLAFGSTASCAL